MSDYLVVPVFGRHGKFVDFESIYDETGWETGSRVVLKDSTSRFERQIASRRYVHLEPNVGIGVWDHYTFEKRSTNVDYCKRMAGRSNGTQ